MLALVSEAAIESFGIVAWFLTDRGVKLGPFSATALQQFFPVVHQSDETKCALRT